MAKTTPKKKPKPAKAVELYDACNPSITIVSPGPAPLQAPLGIGGVLTVVAFVKGAGANPVNMVLVNCGEQVADLNPDNPPAPDPNDNRFYLATFSNLPGGVLYVLQAFFTSGTNTVLSSIPVQT